MRVLNRWDPTLCTAARGLAAFLRAKGYDVDSEASETDRFVCVYCLMNE